MSASGPVVRALLVGGPRDGERWTLTDDRVTWAFPHDVETLVSLWTKRPDQLVPPRVVYYTRRAFDDINEQGERIYRYTGG